jgi:hypothetical protein
VIISQLFGLFLSSIVTVFIQNSKFYSPSKLVLLTSSRKTGGVQGRGYRFPCQGVEHSRIFLIPSPIEGENRNHFENAVIYLNEKVSKRSVTILSHSLASFIYLETSRSKEMFISKNDMLYLSWQLFRFV